MPVMSRPAVDRGMLADRFVAMRARSRALFDLLTPDAYYERPIALRHPIVFYEGHLAAFNLNTLIKRALGQRGIDEGLERLFARGIDPEDEQAVGTSRRHRGRCADRCGPSRTSPTAGCSTRCSRRRSNSPAIRS